MPSIVPTTKVVLTAQSHPEVFQYYGTDNIDGDFVIQYVPQLERWMVTCPDSRIIDLAEAINEFDGLLSVLADTSIIELKTIIDKHIEDVKQTQLQEQLRYINEIYRRLDNDIDKLTLRIQVQEIRKRVVCFVNLVYSISSNVEILRFFNDEMYTHLSISNSDVTQELKNLKGIDEFIKSVGYLNIDDTVLLGIKMEVLVDVPDTTKWAIDNIKSCLGI